MCTSPDLDWCLFVGRTFIYGGAYVATPERAWLVRHWAKLIRHLNPGHTIFILNTPGPVNLPPVGDVYVHHFSDNIGHLAEKAGELPGDGWGRAMCAGVTHAIEADYDSVAFVETDVLLARPVDELVAEMHAADKHFAQPDFPTRRFKESDIFVADVAWLRDTDFIGRYDWPSVRPCVEGFPPPEERLAALTEASHYTLSIHGVRANDHAVTEETARTLDWLTHADQRQYRAFLEGHGWGGLVDD